MESILVLTHCDENGAALSKGSLEALTAGQELAERIHAPLTVGVVAADASLLFKTLPCGALRVIAVSGEAFAQARYASDAAGFVKRCAVQPRRRLFLLRRVHALRAMFMAGRRASAWRVH